MAPASRTRAVALLGLGLYMLSVVPSLYLVEHFDLGPHANAIFKVVYFPLVWLYRQGGWITHLMEQVMHLLGL